MTADDARIPSPATGDLPAGGRDASCVASSAAPLLRLDWHYHLATCKEHTMAESTITAKGQTTVPADIRAQVQAKPGTRLVWSVMPDGTILVRAKSRSILDMAGMLKAPKGRKVKVEDMNPWR
jgi:AbrB family looped-hinge helix DNA binding protein